MGGVEVPQAPRMAGSGEGISSSPLGERSGDPLPRKFFVFSVANTIF